MQSQTLFFHGLFTFFRLFFSFLGLLPHSAHLEEVMETFEEMAVKHKDETIELSHGDSGASHTAEGTNWVVIDTHDQGVRSSSLADEAQEANEVTDDAFGQTSGPALRVAEVGNGGVVVNLDAVFLDEAEILLWNIGAKDFLEFGIWDLADFALHVVTDLLDVIWTNGDGAFFGDDAIEKEVLRRGTNEDLVFAAFGLEAFARDVEVAECVFIEWDFDGLFLAGLEGNFDEALEFDARTEDEGMTFANIELGDFLTIDLTDVLDLEFDTFVGDLEVTISELGVA